MVMVLILWKSLVISEEDDISALLRDLACGLDDRGDFEDNSSVELPKELVDL
jgi:hypothetical protein